MFKVDLSKFDRNDVKIGDYQFITDDKGALKVVKNEKIIAEYNGTEWLFNGKSISAMWEALENHYQAINSLVKNN